MQPHSLAFKGTWRRQVFLLCINLARCITIVTASRAERFPGAYQWDKLIAHEKSLTRSSTQSTESAAKESLYRKLRNFDGEFEDKVAKLHAHILGPNGQDDENVDGEPYFGWRPANSYYAPESIRCSLIQASDRIHTHLGVGHSAFKAFKAEMERKRNIVVNHLVANHAKSAYRDLTDLHRGAEKFIQTMCRSLWDKSKDESENHLNDYDWIHLGERSIYYRMCVENGYICHLYEEIEKGRIFRIDDVPDRLCKSICEWFDPRAWFSK